ncbi:hypothetical protein GCM10010168_53440 [Actinoplanes ianthinogenes]|uniref:Uncharacterized protein n=1 Tax=Actinoplanes ianthinogenes TaxID=122358 RepID=A0ABN6CC92_9ACTN|nr:hypothetical protein [Actinoplanes ianthinogenes]BCJ41658.1 hypothetical protein Aiant_23150 [Actinoplanes ianthinogenes]GGR28610.1 hypothetical protein GCM10010168_53440 [Actinoplanes ianthinogenes]
MKTVGTIVTFIVAVIIRILIVAWVFMIGVAIIRTQWLTELPTIGYVASLGVSTMLSVMAGALGLGSSSKESN